MTSISDRQQAWRPWLIGWAAVAALTVGVFAQVGSFDLLLWDDPVLITENPRFQPVTPENLLSFWQGPYAYLYIPVTMTALGLEAIAAQDPPAAGPITFDPTVFHLTGLAIHLVCVSLVYGLLGRLLTLVNRRGSLSGAPSDQVTNANAGQRDVPRTIAAALGAALFAVHPLHAESVAWVAEQKGLLAAAFGLAALWLYLETLPLAVVPAPEPARHRGRYLVATALFALALLSKPSAVAIPLMAAVLEGGLLRRSRGAIAAALAPWALLAIGLTLWTTAMQAGTGGVPRVPLWVRPLVAGDALTFYAWKTLVPWPLLVDYTRSPGAIIRSGALYYTWPVPIVAVAVWGRLPGARVTLTAVALFIAALAPVLGLMPFGYQAISTVADRYAYLAIFAPALAVAWLAARFAGPLAWGTLTTMIGLLAWLCFQQTALWRSDEPIFAEALRRNEQSWLAHERLAAVEVSRKQYAAAVEHYLAAEKLHRPSLKSQSNLALALAQCGRDDEAEARFLELLERDPAARTALFGLGRIHLTRGDKPGAKAYFDRLFAAAPHDVSAHYQAALALWRAQSIDDARRHLKHCLEVAPALAEAQLALARLAATQNDVQAALTSYQTVERLRPAWLASAAELCWIASTQRAAEHRDASLAAMLEQRLAGIEAPTAQLLDIRAAALAENRRFGEATALAIRAAELAAAEQNAEFASTLAARRALYEAGMPFRATLAELPQVTLAGDATPPWPERPAQDAAASDEESRE